tara:strand:- start:1791 stop:2294 length:504 start_codon:yes stop_codon:yes gene_type:complete
MSLTDNIIMKYKGIWFYGLSGSGKTSLSNIIKKKFIKVFLIDGDLIRKYISFDLGYSQKDRNLQCKRVLGLSKIVIKEKLFPIASTVSINSKILKECKKEKILPIKIERKNMNLVFKSHKTYLNKKNVVGFDLKYGKFKTKKIINDNTEKFFKKLNFFEKILIKKDT